MPEVGLILRDFALAVVTGFVSSLVYLCFFTRRVKPKPEISGYIATHTREIAPCEFSDMAECGASEVSDAPDNRIYQIKVVNRSRYPAVGVRAELLLVRPIPVPNGRVYTTTSVALKRAELLELRAFDPMDVRAEYAFRFDTHKDLTAAYQSGEYESILFRIYATHELSGFGRVFRQSYDFAQRKLSDTFWQGSFEHGESMEVRQGH